MKKQLFIVFAFLTIFSTSLFAADCKVSRTKITAITQAKDGNIFIHFNKASDCSCQFPHRMAFHKDDNESFYISAALTALTAGTEVNLHGSDRNSAGVCPVHGNTAKLHALVIHANP